MSWRGADEDSHLWSSALTGSGWTPQSPLGDAFTSTHSGDPRLARHVGNATVRTDNRGTRIYKEHKHSARRIDLAVCGITAHCVAAALDPGHI
jgi:hypothetical protein